MVPLTSRWGSTLVNRGHFDSRRRPDRRPGGSRPACGVSRVSGGPWCPIRSRSGAGVRAGGRGVRLSTQTTPLSMAPKGQFGCVRVHLFAHAGEAAWLGTYTCMREQGRGGTYL